MMAFMEARERALKLRETMNSARDETESDAAYRRFVAAFDFMVQAPCESAEEVALKLETIAEDAENRFKPRELEAVLRDLRALRGVKATAAA